MQPILPQCREQMWLHAGGESGGHGRASGCALRSGMARRALGYGQTSAMDGLRLAATSWSRTRTFSSRHRPYPACDRKNDPARRHRQCRHANVVSDPVIDVMHVDLGDRSVRPQVHSILELAAPVHSASVTVSSPTPNAAVTEIASRGRA
jgi:hypothetical protein